MSGEAPTAETPTDHASGAAPATGGAAAVPEPSGDERNPIASGSILGIRSDVPGTSDDERPSGAKRRKKSTPQSITQQALEAMHILQYEHVRRSLQGLQPQQHAHTLEAPTIPAQWRSNRFGSGRWQCRHCDIHELHKPCNIDTLRKLSNVYKMHRRCNICKTCPICKLYGLHVDIRAVPHGETLSAS